MCLSAHALACQQRACYSAAGRCSMAEPQKLVSQLSCQGESAALVSGQVRCLWEQADELAEQEQAACQTI